MDATLTGHRDAVCGLLKHCECLISASVDGTIRLWSVGTWGKLRIVQHRGLEDWLRFLVAKMSMLSSGSRGAPWDSDTQCEVGVWSLDLQTDEAVNNVGAGVRRSAGAPPCG